MGGRDEASHRPTQPQTCCQIEMVLGSALGTFRPEDSGPASYGTLRDFTTHQAHSDKAVIRGSVLAG